MTQGQRWRESFKRRHGSYPKPARLHRAEARRIIERERRVRDERPRDSSGWDD